MEQFEQSSDVVHASVLIADFIAYLNHLVYVLPQMREEVRA